MRQLTQIEGDTVSIAQCRQLLIQQLQIFHDCLQTCVKAEAKCFLQHIRTSTQPWQLQEKLFIHSIQPQGFQILLQLREALTVNQIRQYLRFILC